MALQDRITALAQAIGADIKAHAGLLAGKASTSHSHATSDVTGLDDALSGKEPTISAGTTAQYWRGDKTWQTLNKSAVGLGNVDNTSDANKPVSTAQQTALNLKAPLASPTFTGTVSGITKSMVGLGNVDNTSDANKPVSTAQAAAIATATAIHPFLLIGA